MPVINGYIVYEIQWMITLQTGNFQLRESAKISVSDLLFFLIHVHSVPVLTHTLLSLCALDLWGYLLSTQNTLTNIWHGLDDRRSNVSDGWAQWG